MTNKFGTHIKNGVIYSGSGNGGGDSSVVLSKAEYDALSASEKENGTYYIKDWTQPGAGSGNGGSSSLTFDSLEDFNNADHSDLNDGAMIDIPEATELSIKTTVQQCVESTSDTDVVGASALAELSGNLEQLTRKNVTCALYFTTQSGWLVSSSFMYYGKYSKAIVSSGRIIGDRNLSTDEINKLNNARQTIANCSLLYQINDSALTSALSGKIVELTYSLS